MHDSLGNRMKNYEAAYDPQIINRLPVIIRVDGRSFHRVCRKLPKPYDPYFLETMSKTMLSVVTEMSGAVFAYQQSDEITFIVRNDQEIETQPWYKNRIQKICSTTASLTTLHFHKNLSILDKKIELCGDAMFDARVFAVPTISEAVNNLIWRQKDCKKNAITLASDAILSKKVGRETALKMLHGKSSKEKLALMLTECGIDFDHEYPASFRHGVGAYKVPIILIGSNGETTRKKWILDWDLPNFVEERDFIYNLIFNGHDVFRATGLVKG